MSENKSSKIDFLDVMRLSQSQNNFCSAWGEYYNLYCLVKEGQSKPEDIDRKFREVLPKLDRLWNKIKGYLSDEWENIDVRFYYNPYTNLNARRTFEMLIESKGISAMEPYKKVEDYKSCKSLIGSYTHSHKDTFKDTPWNPEDYYNKVLKAVTEDMFQASEFLRREPDKPILKEAKGVAGQQNEFFLSGDMWTLSYEGETISLRNRIGLQYIHYLIDNQGREFSSLEMTRSIRCTTSNKTLIEDGHNKDDILDRKAMEEYKKRYNELKSELEDETTLKCDEERSEITEEMESIKKTLANGTNKRKQSRGFTDNSEKARKAILNAIKRSSKTIQNKHASLWKHLKSSLTTGLYCSYKPEKNMPWKLYS